ncbi:unnamed protein product [Choristocarpus tenellus]
MILTLSPFIYNPLMPPSSPKELRPTLPSVDRATRLAVAMAYVGSEDEPALASSIVASILVTDWADREDSVSLQQDALRHASIAGLLSYMYEGPKQVDIANYVRCRLHRCSCIHMCLVTQDLRQSTQDW